MAAKKWAQEDYSHLITIDSSGLQAQILLFKIDPDLPENIIKDFGGLLTCFG